MAEKDTQNKNSSDCPGIQSKEAGIAEQCKGCPSAKLCSSSSIKIDEDIELISKNLSSTKFIIAVMSGKGGVGKSTITRSIAKELSERNLKTLILDLDLSGPSIPLLTNTDDCYIVESSDRISPIYINDNLYTLSIGNFYEFNQSSVIYNSSIKTAFIKKILKICNFEYDAIVIDTPPNITDEHLAIVNYIKPHASVIVTTPQILSFQDVVRQISFCKKTNIEIFGIIENMKGFTCKNCNNNVDLFRKCNVEEFCIENEIKYLGSLKLDSEIAITSDKGLPFTSDVISNLANLISYRFNQPNDNNL